MVSSSCVKHRVLNPCGYCALLKSMLEDLAGLSAWIRDNAGETGVDSIDQWICCDDCGGMFQIMNGGLVSDVVVHCGDCQPSTEGCPTVALANRYE